MQPGAYGWTDRLVHRMAFDLAIARNLLYDLETSLYKAQLNSTPPPRKPIFITALPRAGTTLLLELLAQHPDLATHSYRDMPFILSPLIWRKLSGRFQVNIDKTARAHDDGMTIDADSPEAFEEVVWRHLAPQLFTRQGIVTCADIAPDIAMGLRDHMVRLIASRAGETPPPIRYLSKNNANIARLGALREHFPDACFVVPLRPPLDHAQSLLRQHLRFRQMHGEDAFARRYMHDIGHFEFGDLHRPILFPGLCDETRDLEPDRLEYWLRYWNCAYRHLMDRDDIIWIDMQAFTRDTEMPSLLRRLELSEAPGVIDTAKRTVKPMRSYESPGRVPAEVLETSHSLHRALVRKSEAGC
ncbi:MAG: sulfotransferase [Thalassovita sp.]|nr:sulfotransferase [Thalassovita sp.]